MRLATFESGLLNDVHRSKPSDKQNARRISFRASYAPCRTSRRKQLPSV